VKSWHTRVGKINDFTFPFERWGIDSYWRDLCHYHYYRKEAWISLHAAQLNFRNSASQIIPPKNIMTLTVLRSTHMLGCIREIICTRPNTCEVGQFQENTWFNRKLPTQGWSDWRILVTSIRKLLRECEVEKIHVQFWRNSKKTVSSFYFQIISILQLT